VTQRYIDVNDDMKRRAVELVWSESKSISVVLHDTTRSNRFPNT